MDGDRTINAYCEVCGEPTEHLATASDPGTCTCTVCGTQQPLMVPIK